MIYEKFSVGFRLQTLEEVNLNENEHEHENRDLEKWTEFHSIIVTSWLVIKVTDHSENSSMTFPPITLSSSVASQQQQQQHFRP